MKLDPYLTSYTKINSNCIADLDIRPEIIKLLDKNIGEKSHCIGLSSDFVDMISKAPTKNKNK